MSRVQDDRDLGAFIPAFLDDYGLTPDEFRLYARLVRRAGNGRAFESVPNMAVNCGVSERQVRYILRSFELAGMVTSRPRVGHSTIYNLTGGSKWVDAGGLAEIRSKVRCGDPSKKPTHRKKTPAHGAAPTPASGAEGFCTPCRPTPAPGAGQQTPARCAAEGISEANKDNHEGGRGVGANALKNQTPPIDFPDSIPESERKGLGHKLSALPENQRADVLATLAHRLERVAGGKASPIDDIQAYTVGLIHKAKLNQLDVPQAVAAARQNTELEDRLTIIKQSIDGGGQLMVDGAEVEVMWPLAKVGNGFANVAALIQQGAKIEVCHV